ncbi:MAG: gluconate:H+ symporter, GntP family protein [Gammaproteobacteria bacterium]|nr:MAG: gluconate:H+ symporter, GntP family protein [Gammaproteobacteria bacterium]
MSEPQLLVVTAGAIAVLVVLIGVLRVNAFLALTAVSLLTALAAGIPVGEIAGVVQAGMGATLGYIALVIGLGAILGEMLVASGGARRLADGLLAWAGPRGAPWALTLLGVLVAVPVFFEVALLLFIPLVYSLARRSGRSAAYYGLPLAAGIAVGHAFVPPTPGPVAVAAMLEADLGLVIAVGLAAGLPAALVAGVWFGRWAGSRLPEGVPDTVLEEEARAPAQDAPFGAALMVVLLPLVLILANTVGKLWLGEAHPAAAWLALIGHPFSALLAAAALALWWLGARRGFGRAELQAVADRAMRPVGMIILLTGAGGAFGKVLVKAGVGDALVRALDGSGLPVLLFAFLVAALLRVAQGSATVAMVTTAGLLAPIVAAADAAPVLRACTVIAIAGGATVLSHVNDSGFWLVKQLLGLDARQTLFAWTTLETLVGLVGLIGAGLIAVAFA